MGDWKGIVDAGKYSREAGGAESVNEFCLKNSIIIMKQDNLYGH